LPRSTKADRVHDREATGERRGDRALLVYVAAYRRNAGVAIRKQRPTAIAMARGDPDGKPGVAQLAHDAPPEKAGATKHCHRLCGRRGGHDARILPTRT
jgi:hypothetical protein